MNIGGSMDAIKILLTALLSVAALFAVTKMMGHKQVAQLDFFDYVSGITIGSIGAELATDLEAPWKALIALVIYGLVSVVLSFLTHKMPVSRKYINGTPTVLMSGNKLYRKNMKKARLDLSEFMLLCREQGYFDLEEIETAIFEHNGRLSILPKSAKRPLTPYDMMLTPRQASISIELIMDGRVITDNLLRLGRDALWLKKRMRSQGYESETDVFLAVYSREEDRLTVYPGE